MSNEILKADKPLTIIEWGDATYSSMKYYDKHKKSTPINTITVGFLVEYDDERALLYTDYFKDGDYRNEIIIPTAMIRNIYTIDYE